MFFFWFHFCIISYYVYIAKLYTYSQAYFWLFAEMKREMKWVKANKDKGKVEEENRNRKRRSDWDQGKRKWLSNHTECHGDSIQDETHYLYCWKKPTIHTVGNAHIQSERLLSWGEKLQPTLWLYASAEGKTRNVVAESRRNGSLHFAKKWKHSNTANSIMVKLYYLFERGFFFISPRILFVERNALQQWMECIHIAFFNPNERLLLVYPTPPLHFRMDVTLNIRLNLIVFRLHIIVALIEGKHIDTDEVDSILLGFSVVVILVFPHTLCGKDNIL